MEKIDPLYSIIFPYVQNVDQRTAGSQIQGRKTVPPLKEIFNEVLEMFLRRMLGEQNRRSSNTAIK